MKIIEAKNYMEIINCRKQIKYLFNKAIISSSGSVGLEAHISVIMGSYDWLVFEFLKIKHFPWAGLICPSNQ